MPMGKFCTTSFIIPAKKIKPQPIEDGFFKTKKNIIKQAKLKDRDVL